ncbi:hypothetical protein V8C26DRAFT_380209 [Trichoderma gracile]
MCLQRLQEEEGLLVITTGAFWGFTLLIILMMDASYVVFLLSLSPNCSLLVLSLFRLIALDWRSWVVRLKGLLGWEMDRSGLDERGLEGIDELFCYAPFCHYHYFYILFLPFLPCFFVDVNCRLYVMLSLT